jgi:hypothetical protein
VEEGCRGGERWQADADIQEDQVGRTTPLSVVLQGSIISIFSAAKPLHHCCKGSNTCPRLDCGHKKRCEHKK